MARPKKKDGREILSLSLPADLADEVSRRAEKSGLSKAQLVRQAMSIGITVRDDLLTLARAVRDVRKRPEAYSTSTKIALHEAVSAALKSRRRFDSSVLPGDLEDLEGYQRKSGPYQVAENGWVCGPFNRKVHGDSFDYHVTGEPEHAGSAVSVSIGQKTMHCHTIELDGRPYFVYTNLKRLGPAHVKVFERNIMKTWDQIEASDEE